MSDSLRPMDCSPPGSSAHRILQARILEWIALLRGIFLTQGLNSPLFLYWQVGSSSPVPPGLLTSLQAIVTGGGSQWYSSLRGVWLFVSLCHPRVTYFFMWSPYMVSQCDVSSSSTVRLLIWHLWISKSATEKAG